MLANGARKRGVEGGTAAMATALTIALGCTAVARCLPFGKSRSRTHVVYVIMLAMFAICCVRLVSAWCPFVAMRRINKLNEISNISLAIYL